MNVTIKPPKKRYFGSITDEYRGKHNIIKAELLLTLNLLAQSGLKNLPSIVIERHACRVTARYINRRAGELIEFGLIKRSPFIHNLQLCYGYSLGVKGKEFISKMPPAIRERIEGPLLEKNCERVTTKDLTHIPKATQLQHIMQSAPEKKISVIQPHSTLQPANEPAQPEPEPEQQPMLEGYLGPVQYLCWEGRDCVYFVDVTLPNFKVQQTNNITSIYNARVNGQQKAFEVYCDIKSGKFRLMVDEHGDVKQLFPDKTG